MNRCHNCKRKLKEGDLVATVSTLHKLNRYDELFPGKDTKHVHLTCVTNLVEEKK